jgi:hypothetical protein
MGNKIAAELIDALRLSTFGTTLCSRTVDQSPAMVDISDFTGVGKALVRFFGDYSVPNTICQITRTQNVSAVVFVQPGQYRVIFNDAFRARNINNYIVSGHLEKDLSSLSAADNFYILSNQTNSNLNTTFSSFRMVTTNTTATGVSSVNARWANLIIF